MRVAVCIPWRPQPTRLPAFYRAMEFWEDYPVYFGDSEPTQPFHRSQARNNAVKSAAAEIVIIADADTVCEMPALRRAVDLANGGAVVYPFTRYRAMPAEAVAYDLDDLYVVEPSFTKYDAAGGILVCTSDLFWWLGGYDERFGAVWGYEDKAFKAAAETLAAVERVEGIAWSFDHENDREPTAATTRSRWKLYQFAYGKPEVMRELLIR